MFCPRCGQEQASGDLRFCSRCGLPMGVVAEVVAGGGTLPQLTELHQKKSLINRGNGLKIALVWFLVLDFLLVPLIAIMDGGELVPILAILGFVGALIITIFSLLFLKSAPTNQNFQSLPESMPQDQRAFMSNQTQNALPPQQTQTAQEYTAPPQQSWKAPDTGELVSPGSVTEGTTKLLKKDE